QEIDVAEALERRSDKRVDLLGFAYVRDLREAAASKRFDVARGRRQVCFAPTCDDDIRTESRERERDLATDAAAAAGDEGGATREQVRCESRQRCEFHG